MIPFVDLSASHQPIRAEIDAAINAVIHHSDFVLGASVHQFETEWAGYCGTAGAVGVSSGTAALFLALKALDVQEGDEVIVPAHTFIATAMAVSHCGATPVFADVDPANWNISLEYITGLVTDRTKAVIVVHLYGNPADMDAVLEYCRARNIYVVEDAAQAHGALYKGKRAGSLADVGCFSFYPSKNLGAIGEGGAVVSDHPEILHRVQMLRDYGRTDKYLHAAIGYNLRLQGIQAAVLSVKLKYLEAWNADRRRIATQYHRLLKDVPDLHFQETDPVSQSVYHLMVISTGKRETLIKGLQAAGIGYGIHYPVPCHLQPAYADRSYKAGSLPVSEKLAATSISLPMYPGLTDEAVAIVSDCILNILGS